MENRSHMQRTCLEQNLAQPATRQMVHDKVLQNTLRTNLYAAKNILHGQLVASLTAQTAAKIDDLVPLASPPGELEAQQSLFESQ